MSVGSFFVFDKLIFFSVFLRREIGSFCVYKKGLFVVKKLVREFILEFENFGSLRKVESF